MHRVKSILWGSRKRRASAVVAAFLITVASTATAAFMLFSGVNGTSNGAITSTISTVTAVAVSSTANPTLTPGAPSSAVAYPLVFTNADPDVPHSIAAGSLNYVVSSNGGAVCANGVNLSAGTGSTWNTLVSAGVPSIPASGTNTTAGAGVKIFVDGNIPGSCAGKTFTITFSGTSSP
jgi:hypothetical protein